MIEIWKDIKEFIRKYQVSNFGRVKRISGYRVQENNLLTGTINPFGYLIHSLRSYSGGVSKLHRRQAHRLVALSFIPNPENKRCVNHKDGNKLNNHVDNLEWNTHAENNKHAYDMGLKQPPFTAMGEATHVNAVFDLEDCRNILGLRNQGWKLQEIADKYDVGLSSAARVCSGNHWSAKYLGQSQQKLNNDQ